MAGDTKRGIRLTACDRLQISSLKMKTAALQRPCGFIAAFLVPGGGPFAGPELALRLCEPQSANCGCLRGVRKKQFEKVLSIGDLNW